MPSLWSSIAFGRERVARRGNHWLRRARQSGADLLGRAERTAAELRGRIAERRETKTPAGASWSLEDRLLSRFESALGRVSRELRGSVRCLNPEARNTIDFSDVGDRGLHAAPRHDANASLPEAELVEVAAQPETSALPPAARAAEPKAADARAAEPKAADAKAAELHEAVSTESESKVEVAPVVSVPAKADDIVSAKSDGTMPAKSDVTMAAKGATMPAKASETISATAETPLADEPASDPADPAKHDEPGDSSVAAEAPQVDAIVHAAEPIRAANAAPSDVDTAEGAAARKEARPAARRAKSIVPGAPPPSNETDNSAAPARRTKTVSRPTAARATKSPSSRASSPSAQSNGVDYLTGETEPVRGTTRWVNPPDSEGAGSKSEPSKVEKREIDRLAKLSAKALIAELPKLSTPQLEALLERERSTKKRKTVIHALTSRLPS